MLRSSVACVLSPDLFNGLQQILYKVAYARLIAQLKAGANKHIYTVMPAKSRSHRCKTALSSLPYKLVHQLYMQGLQTRQDSVHTYHGVHSMHNAHSMHVLHSIYSVRIMHSVHSVHIMHMWSNLLSCCDLKQSLYAYSTATRTWSRLSTRLWRDGRGQWRLCHQQRQKRKHSRPAGKQTKPACCTSLTSWAGDVFLKPCSSSLDRWFHWHQEHHCSGYYADWVPFTVYHREHCVVV